MPMTHDEIKKMKQLFNRSEIAPNGDIVLWSDAQAPGAIPNGTQVEKCGSVRFDAHQDGAQGHVVGSIGPVDGDMYGYFVVWDDMENRMPVSVTSTRIKPVKVN